MLIPQKGRAIAKHTISLIIYAVCAVDLYCWNRLGSPITPTLLNTFLLTDSSEATEALSSYLDIRSILPALIPVTLGATHTVLASCKKCRSMIKDIAQKFCMHMGIATTALFVVSTTTCFKNEIYLFHRLILGHDEKETYMATGTEPTLRFYTPLHRLANAIVEIGCNHSFAGEHRQQPCRQLQLYIPRDCIDNRRELQPPPLTAVWLRQGNNPQAVTPHE